MTRHEALDFPRHRALRVTEFPGKGRGVVAGEPIAGGELLEVAPVIPLKADDQPTRGSIMYDYPFLWDDPPYVEAIALGVISMINHSDAPNAAFEIDVPRKVVRLFAIRDVAPGEEVTFDYQIPLWFEAHQ